MRKTLLLFLIQLLFVATLFAKQTPLPLVVVVGGDYNFPPFEYLDKNGNPTGYNVELTKAVAKEMGFFVSFQLGPWDEVRQQLLDGEIDVIEGLSYSQQRAELYDFSIPHMITYRTIFIKSGNRSIKNIDDLAGKRVLVQKEDAAHDYLRERHFVGKIEAVKTQEEALKKLSLEKYDAAIVTKMYGLYLRNKHKLWNVTAIDYPIEPRKYCFAVKKGNIELLSLFNEGLNQLKATGKYQEIHEKWFGVYEDDSQLKIDIEKAIGLAIPLVLLVGLFALWNFSLSKQVEKKTTELKLELEEKSKLHHELERERNIFISGPVIVMKWDLREEGYIEYMSPNINQFGYSPEQFTSRQLQFKQIIHPEDCERVVNDSKVYIEQHQPFFEQTFRILTANGEPRWLYDFTSVIYDEDGKLADFYGYLLDLSEQKKIEQELIFAKEQAEEANAIKGNFLANMSHEIRTPLNGIIGFTEVLLNMNITGETREFVEIILKAGTNLIQLVNDILDFSKIEEGKLELCSAELSLSTLIRETLLPFQLQVVAKNIELRTIISSDIPDPLIGDSIRIRQVLTNLIGNAVKFTPKGTIEISVESLPSLNKDAFILFKIRDTGIGIPEEKQQVIFDRFTQADAGTNRRYGGTGLGLAISKRLVEMMNGYINVESHPNEGSLFYFGIPLAVPDYQDTHTPITKTLVSYFPRTPMRVLLLGSGLSTSLLKAMLEKHGIEVIHVGVTDDIAPLYYEYQPHFILIKDRVLPDYYERIILQVASLDVVSGRETVFIIESSDFSEEYKQELLARNVRYIFAAPASVSQYLQALLLIGKH